MAAGLALLPPEERGLCESPGICDGGVSRLERLLTFTEADGGGLGTVEYGKYRGCGGGNSKTGRLLAAGRRAVRLEPAPEVSKCDAIPVDGSGPFATVKEFSRF